MKSQKHKSEQQSSRQRRVPIWKEGIEKSMTWREKADVKFTRAKEFLGLSALHGPFLLQLQHRRSEDPLDLLWHVPPGLVVLGLDYAAWLHLSRRGGRERTVWLHSMDSYHVRSECCHSLLCKKTCAATQETFKCFIWNKLIIKLTLAPLPLGSFYSDWLPHANRRFEEKGVGLLCS